MNQRYGQVAYSSRVDGPKSLISRIRSRTRIELQRAGSQAAVLGPRPDRRLGSRQLALAGRRSRLEDGLRQASAAGLLDDRLVALLEILRQHGREQVSRTSSTYGDLDVAPPSSSALRQESQSRCFGRERQTEKR